MACVPIHANLSGFVDSAGHGRRPRWLTTDITMFDSDRLHQNANTYSPNDRQNTWCSRTTVSVMLNRPVCDATQIFAIYIGQKQESLMAAPSLKEIIWRDNRAATTAMNAEHNGLLTTCLNFMWKDLSNLASCAFCCIPCASASAWYWSWARNNTIGRGSDEGAGTISVSLCMIGRKVCTPPCLHQRQWTIIFTRKQLHCGAPKRLFWINKIF